MVSYGPRSSPSSRRTERRESSPERDVNYATVRPVTCVRCEGEYLATASDLAHAQEIIADELGVGPIELRTDEDDDVGPRWIVVGGLAELD